MPAPGDAAGRYSCFDVTGRFLGVVDADGGLLRAVRLIRSGVDASG